MSCDPEYICLICLQGFDQPFKDRGRRRPKCPCGSDEVLPYEDYQENEAINAQEQWAESWEKP